VRYTARVRVRVGVGEDLAHRLVRYTARVRVRVRARARGS
jgi:hypothetical protein